jgi:hypothetical protein
MKTRIILLNASAVVAMGLMLASCGAKKTGTNSLKVDKTTVKSGDQITVTFTAEEGLDQKAWIGLIPSSTAHGSEVTNDQFDVAYKYLNGQVTGSMTFTAPETGGSFDFRLNESDSKPNAKELATVSFTVEAVAQENLPNAITLDKTEFKAGEQIVVKYTSQAGMDKNAWIGIIPSEIEHGTEATNDMHDVSFVYLNGKNNATVNMVAPSKPGSYDLRMNESDSKPGAKELTSTTITVK